jgi:hypothetical protein
MSVSFWYHKQQDKKAAQQMNESTIEMPAQQRTRFFREQLGLSTEQVNVFRDLNRSYNRQAHQITVELENLRLKMVKELGAKQPDEKRLSEISSDIGNLHAELKQITIDYYLAMKIECDETQQKKLNEIFMSTLKKNEDVDLPQRGRHFRGNFNN